MVILRKSKHFSVLPPSLPIAAQSKAMFFIILEIIYNTPALCNTVSLAQNEEFLYPFNNRTAVLKQN